MTYAGGQLLFSESGLSRAFTVVYGRNLHSVFRVNQVLPRWPSYLA
jgi:hypothetical protein